MKGLFDLRCLSASIVLFLLSTVSLQAQVSITALNDDTDGNKITSLLSTTTTEDLQGLDTVWNEIYDRSTIGELNFGFTESYHWVAKSVVNDSENNIWLLEIQNPHINELEFYIRIQGSEDWITLDETGRSKPFSTRRVAHFNFVLPFELEQGQSADLLLMLDKRRSSLNYHMNIWSLNRFNEVQQVHYAAYGVYFGMFLLVIFITGIAYIGSYKRIYLWYLLYVLSVGLFVFNDTGLAHQYLYPGSAEIGGFARILLTYMMLATFILFTRAYFYTKSDYKDIHRYFQLLLILLIIHGGIYLFFTEWFRTSATMMIIMLYGLILSSIALAIYISFLHLKKDRESSVLFILAFSFIFIAGIIFISTEFGLLPEFQFLFTPIQIGSAFEIIFLGAGIAWRVRVVQKQQVSLNERINRLQNEKLLAYIDGTEKERSRVAMDLHDSIGNRLGHLKRTIELNSVSGDDLQHELKDIIQDVRTISHKLAPPSINLTGLEYNLRHLIQETGNQSSIAYTFQSLDLPDHLTEDLNVQLYRIVQEGIQNIEKHSSATKADIQLIAYGDELVLTIEDDGVGISSKSKESDGIGLDNIKRRVDFLKGTLEITSRQNRGVQLFISIPIS